MFKVKNKDTKAKPKIFRNTNVSYSLISARTCLYQVVRNVSFSENFWRRSGVFIVNSEHISHLALVFLLLTLSR